MGSQSQKPSVIHQDPNGWRTLNQVVNLGTELGNTGSTCEVECWFMNIYDQIPSNPPAAPDNPLHFYGRSQRFESKTWCLTHHGASDRRPGGPPRSFQSTICCSDPDSIDPNSSDLTPSIRTPRFPLSRSTGVLRFHRRPRRSDRGSHGGPGRREPR